MKYVLLMAVAMGLMACSNKDAGFSVDEGALAKNKAERMLKARSADQQAQDQALFESLKEAQLTVVGSKIRVKLKFIMESEYRLDLEKENLDISEDDFIKASNADITSALSIQREVSIRPSDDLSVIEVKITNSEGGMALLVFSKNSEGVYSVI